MKTYNRRRLFALVAPLWLLWACSTGDPSPAEPGDTTNPCPNCASISFALENESLPAGWMVSVSLTCAEGYFQEGSAAFESFGQDGELAHLEFGEIPPGTCDIAAVVLDEDGQPVAECQPAHDTAVVESGETAAETLEITCAPQEPGGINFEGSLCLLARLGSPTYSEGHALRVGETTRIRFQPTGGTGVLQQLEVTVEDPLQAGIVSIAARPDYQFDITCRTAGPQDDQRMVNLVASVTQCGVTLERQHFFVKCFPGYESQGDLSQGFPVLGEGGAGRNVVVDAQGNVWASGITSSIYEPGDLWLYQWDRDGILKSGFPKFYPNGHVDGGNAMAADGQGGIWLAGNVYGDGSRPAFALWHFDSQGDLYAGFPIVRQEGTTESANSYATGLALDGQGRVWMTGVMEDAAHDRGSLVLWNFDAQGQLAAGFPVVLPGPAATSGQAIAVDSADNVWVAGAYKADMSESLSVSTLWKFTPQGTIADGYPLLRLGEYDAVLGSMNGDGGMSKAVAVDPEGRVWVAGYVRDPGAKLYVAVFEPDGTKALEELYVAPFAANFESQALSVAIDDNGNAWVTGFNADPNVPESPRMVLFKFDPQGHLASGFPQEPDANSGYGIATDSAGYVWVVGPKATPEGDRFSLWRFE